MVEKEDLCLSLSLNFPAAVERNRFCNSSSPQLNLLVSSSTCFNLLRPASNGNDCFPSSSDLEYVSAVRGETKSFMKGIDVNLMPELAMDVEEVVVGVSSPTSSVSSVSGNKRSGRRASPLGISDEDDGHTSRKKLRLSKDQSAVLEESFKQHHTLNPKQKHELAKRLGLRPRQVEVWFQNRRARRKLKQKEVEYELIKRCCENLTEENMKLQKELQELKTIKLSPQIPYHLHHERCPSCEIWADHEQRLR